MKKKQQPPIFIHQGASYRNTQPAPDSVPAFMKGILVFFGLAFLGIIAYGFLSSIFDQGGKSPAPSGKEIQEEAKAKQTSDIAKMMDVQRQYAKLHKREDDWFMPLVPPPGFFEKAADVVWKRGEDIRRKLASHRNDSNETAAIWDKFQDFGVSLQITLLPKVATIANPTSADLKGLRSGREIAFLPKQLLETAPPATRQIYMLTWRSDLGVSIAAIEWPEKFLVGVLYHQLFYGLHHPVGADNYLAPGSAEAATEMAQAHRVESTVINAATAGAYYKHFEEIGKRVDFDPKKVTAAVTIEDLKHFDKILEMEDAGFFVAGLAVSQHLLGLIVYCAEKRGMRKEEWGKHIQNLHTIGVVTNFSK